MGGIVVVVVGATKIAGGTHKNMEARCFTVRKVARILRQKVVVFDDTAAGKMEYGEKRKRAALWRRQFSGCLCDLVIGDWVAADQAIVGRPERLHGDDGLVKWSPEGECEVNKRIRMMRNGATGELMTLNFLPLG